MSFIEFTSSILLDELLLLIHRSVYCFCILFLAYSYILINNFWNACVPWSLNFSLQINLYRYWSHVVNCKSCNSAYKSLNVAEVILQIISVASIGIVATMKQGTMSVATRNSMVVLAVLSFALSRWLAHFIYKNFRYHDYDHAFR